MAEITIVKTISFDGLVGDGAPLIVPSGGDSTNIRLRHSHKPLNLVDPTAEKNGFTSRSGSGSVRVLLNGFGTGTGSKIKTLNGFGTGLEILYIIGFGFGYSQFRGYPTRCHPYSRVVLVVCYFSMFLY